MWESLGKVAKCRACMCRPQALGMYAQIQMSNCTLANLTGFCVSGVRCRVALGFNNEELVILGVFGSQAYT